MNQNEYQGDWKKKVTGAISIIEDPNTAIEDKEIDKEQLIEVAEHANDRRMWRDTVKLYVNYKKTSDQTIQRYLNNIKLLVKGHKGEGSVFGYYYMADESVEKIKAGPRSTSLNFDATEFGELVKEDLKELKTITFLVKSSSRFFLKADIGEVFDQIDHHDLWSNKIKAIYVKLGNYEVIPGSQGEHFIMEAVLFE